MTQNNVVLTCSQHKLNGDVEMKETQGMTQKLKNKKINLIEFQISNDTTKYPFTIN